MNVEAGKKKKIFLICPVREVTDTEKEAIAQYVAALKKDGHSVYWPLTDTNQDDSVGLRICQDNRAAIIAADEIHIWWNGKSQGSIFDFGMAFGLNKKIVLVNYDEVPATPYKSFNNVLREIGTTKETLTPLEKFKLAALSTEEVTDDQVEGLFLEFEAGSEEELLEVIEIVEIYRPVLWQKLQKEHRERMGK
ncbi:MAG: nucleoside 2-deoxyribosyltransferase [Patescibacteria group bacterium]|nr:nucleoside 2-deoxyribosyltransferase [Patescibacteria group bacterium]